MKIKSYFVSIFISTLLCFLVISAVYGFQLGKHVIFLLLDLVLIVYIILKRNEKHIKSLFFIYILFMLIFWINSLSFYHICIDKFSVTAFAFLIINTIFVVMFNRKTSNEFFGIKSILVDESPIIWERAHKVNSVFSSCFEIPLFLLIFLSSGHLKFILSFIIILTSVVIGAIVGLISAIPLYKEFSRRQNEELKKQSFYEETGYLKREK